MRENIYGPENRVVSAQMGYGYSMPMWLPSQERLGYATIRKAYWGEPTVKYHTGSSQAIVYPYGIGYHNTLEWGVYNSRGELVSTQFGTWDSEPLYGENGKTYIKYTWNNFPSNGMSAAWVTTTGQAVLTYQEEPTVRMSLGQYISPTYQEVLAADREVGLSGTFGVLQTATGEALGTIYEDFWWNGLNDSYSRYYRHYQMTSTPMWGGTGRVAYYNTDKTSADYPVNTVGYSTLVSELPSSILIGDTYLASAEVFNFHISPGGYQNLPATSANIDRGDGVRLTHLGVIRSWYVGGDGAGEAYEMSGSFVASDSGFPSSMRPGATLARFTFSNWYVDTPATGQSHRFRHQKGVLNGSYVEGHEDTVTFTPIEYHEAASAQCSPASLAGVRSLYAFLRAERISATARLQALLIDRFRKRLAEYLSGAYSIGVADTRVVKRSAKKSTWAYRDPALTVSIHDTSAGEGITRREVHLSYPVVENGETVIREGVIVGTLWQRTETQGAEGGAAMLYTYDNYYAPAAVPLLIDYAESCKGREPDLVSFGAKYPGRIATGLCTMTGTFRSSGAATSTIRLADAYYTSDSDLHTTVSLRANFNFPPDMPPITTEVPEFIQQYLKEVPIQYMEGAGTPAWVETATYEGQRIALTWFGPKGKGAFAMWEDSDTELEVYGQLQCRYDEEQNELVILQWVEVKKANHSFLVPGVRRIIETDTGTTETLEDVSLPTAVAPRLPGLWKNSPYADIFGTSRDNYNCIVTFSNIKAPDVKATVRDEKEAWGDIVPLEEYVLSVFNGL